MQKHSILLMFVLAAIILVNVNYAREPQVAISACLPTSCGSFGCCSGNCQPWCRACGVPHACG